LNLLSASGGEIIPDARIDDSGGGGGGPSARACGSCGSTFSPSPAAAAAAAAAAAFVVLDDDAVVLAGGWDGIHWIFGISMRFAAGREHSVSPRVAMMLRGDESAASSKSK